MICLVPTTFGRKRANSMVLPTTFKGFSPEFVYLYLGNGVFTIGFYAERLKYLLWFYPILYFVWLVEITYGDYMACPYWLPPIVCPLPSRFFIHLYWFDELNMFLSCPWCFSRERLGRFGCGFKRGFFLLFFKNRHFLLVFKLSLTAIPALSFYYVWPYKSFPAAYQVMMII